MSRVTCSRTSPASVNLTGALPSRLSRTWRSRVGSPIRSLGTSGGNVAQQGQSLLIGPERHHLRHLVEQIGQRKSRSAVPDRVARLRPWRDRECRRSGCSRLRWRGWKICTYLSCSALERGARERRSAMPMMACVSACGSRDHAGQEIRLGLAGALGRSLGLLQFDFDFRLALGHIARGREHALQRPVPVVVNVVVVIGHDRLCLPSRAQAVSS